jgi:murein DD-endopeptidase MepM/ murein hydrolase activator NlpD
MTGRNVPSILPVSLEKGWVSSEFGMRIHPITGKRRPHYGIDLAVDEGVPVKATADGKVIFAGDAGGYGNLVRIDHGNGIETRYAHNSALKVRAGERVRKGQVIALAGHSGLATGDHLHYEVRVEGKPVNPRDYLPPFTEGGRSKQ